MRDVTEGCEALIKVTQTLLLFVNAKSLMNCFINELNEIIISCE